MASFFNLTLDTTAPSGLSFTINGGAGYTTSRTVTLAISVTDASTTGYMMRIWGIDDGTGTTVTEQSAQWEAYSATKTVTLPSGDGTKTIYMIVRDAVGNAMTVQQAVSRSIILDTTVPVVTVTGPDNAIISATGTITTAAFTFAVTENAEAIDFIEYKVMLVESESATHDNANNIQIPTVNGSTNMTGITTTDNPFNTNSTPISCTITGADLAAAASASGDGVKIIKVFAKDTSGQWSVA